LLLSFPLSRHLSVDYAKEYAEDAATHAKIEYGKDLGHTERYVDKARLVVVRAWELWVNTEAGEELVENKEKNDSLWPSMQQSLKSLSHVVGISDPREEDGDDLPCEINSLAYEEEREKLLEPDTLIERLLLDDVDLLEGV
jgi:hypothetical protein